jgi:hypothetical protein
MAVVTEKDKLPAPKLSGRACKEVRPSYRRLITRMGYSDYRRAAVASCYEGKQLGCVGVTKKVDLG